MKTKDWLLHFAVTFAIAFLVTIIMSGCWNFFIAKKGFTVNWESSIAVGIVLGITLTLTQRTKGHSNS